MFRRKNSDPGQLSSKHNVQVCTADWHYIYNGVVRNLRDIYTTIHSTAWRLSLVKCSYKSGQNAIYRKLKGVNLFSASHLYSKITTLNVWPCMCTSMWIKATNTKSQFFSAWIKIVACHCKIKVALNGVAGASVCPCESLLHHYSILTCHCLWGAGADWLDRYHALSGLHFMSVTWTTSEKTCIGGGRIILISGFTWFLNLRYFKWMKQGWRIF
jgi:hypothetical protein